MTKSIHPRRALAESEAQAWLDLHADWAAGLPAEVRDTTIKGQLFHDHIGDGWDTLWWQSTASDLKQAEAKPTHTTPRCAVDSDYDQSLPTIERRQVQAGRLGDYGLQPAAPARIVAQAGTQDLHPVTVVLGDRVPSSMLFPSVPRQKGNGDSERSHLFQALDSHRYRTQAYACLEGTVDSSWQEQLAAAELISWLRLEAGCTDKEIEALERRAAGQPVPDRHCLARAQRRARAALA